MAKKKNQVLGRYNKVTDLTIGQSLEDIALIPFCPSVSLLTMKILRKNGV
jgi:hypothetical protein